MSQPTPDQQPTEADLAAAAGLTALVAAQAARRAMLTRQAVAIATEAAQRFTGWYDTGQITEWAASLASRIETLQRTAAKSTDVYLAQTLTKMLDRRIRPIGAVQVADLRAGVTHAGAYARAADTYRWQQSRFDLVGRQLAAGNLDVNPPDLIDPVTAAVQRVASVAETDIQLADREQARQVLVEHEHRDVRGYRRVIHPELSKGGTCGLCIAASDRVYHVKELRPIHDRCVPGDTVIAAEGVSVVTRRHYPGPLVVLATAAGEQLRVTANHPVLTEDGWLPAGLVGVGDQVVHHRRGQGVVGRRPDEGKRPTTVEEIWRAATVNHGLHPRAVPLTAEHFHGDGTDGEVDVVTPDGVLADVGDVTFAQPSSELLLVPGHPGRIGLPGERGFDEAFLGLGYAAHGSVGGRRLASAIFASHAAGAHGTGGAGVALFDAGGQESTFDGLSGYVQIARDGQHRFAGLIPAHDRLVRQAQPNAARFDPAFAKFAGEGRHAYAELGRDLRQRLTTDVELDRVVDKRWVEGPHVVYNLQTREGWYSADNLIVSNCECTTLPIVGQLDPGSGLNNLDLRGLYTEAGDSTSSAALKRTRYQIDDHGELGPVLNPAGAKVRTARQSTADANATPRTAKSDAEKRAQTERIRKSLAAALPRAKDLAGQNSNKWGGYLAQLEARLRDLDQQLAA